MPTRLAPLHLQKPGVLVLLIQRADEREVACPDRARAVATAEILKTLVTDIAVFRCAKVSASETTLTLSHIWHIV
jgi:hypothetical protein